MGTIFDTNLSNERLLKMLHEEYDNGYHKDIGTFSDMRPSRINN